MTLKERQEENRGIQPMTDNGLKINKTDYAFFMSPQEQIELISDWVRNSNFDIIMHDYKKNYEYEVLTVSSLQTLRFESNSNFGMCLYLHNKAISRDIIYTKIETPNGIKNEINMTQSGVILLEPSKYITGDRVLLLGRIAIFKPKYYKEAGFEHIKILNKWYKEVVNKIIVLSQTNKCKSVAEDNAQTASWADIMFSKGACVMSKEGIKLKQFANGIVQFFPQGN